MMRDMGEDEDTTVIKRAVYRRTADNRIPLRPLMCSPGERDSLVTPALSRASAIAASNANAFGPSGGRNANGRSKQSVHDLSPEALSGANGWGLLQLLERGKLPSSCVDLEPILTANGIMQATRAQIHRNRPSHSTTVMTESSGFAQMKNIRLDYREIDKLPAKLNLSELRQWEEQEKSATSNNTGKEMESAVMYAPSQQQIAANEADMLQAVVHDLERADPRNYSELLDLYSMHEFIIRKGKALRSTPEFASFKRRYQDSWGSIESAILFFEKTLQRYGIELAYIDGRRLAALATTQVGVDSNSHKNYAELGEADLLHCVANREEVEPFLGSRERRYRHGKNGLHAAATVIQSGWRMYIQRVAYKHILVGTRAARLIQQQWATHRAHVMTHRAIQSLREARVVRWRQTMERFVQNWSSLMHRQLQGSSHSVLNNISSSNDTSSCSVRRTIIHIPSLSYPCFHAAKIPFYMAQQMGQLTRLMDLADESVDVVLITPYKPEPEVVQYYLALLTAAGVRYAEKRLTLLTPDAVARLPDKMSLTRLILLSTRLMKCLRLLTCGGGKLSYIVPGVVGPEELALASQLNLPLLSADSRTMSVFGHKSGGQRLFEAAGVATPFGATRLHSTVAMLRALARLMLTHREITRWLVKLETESGSRGHAYFDTKRVRCLRRRGVGEEAHDVHRVSPTHKRAGCSNSNDDSDMRHDNGIRKVTGVALGMDCASATSEISNRTKDASRSDDDAALFDTLLAELIENGATTVRLIHPSSYPNFAAYCDMLDQVGATIQAVPAKIVASVTANLFIEPSGAVHLQSIVQPTQSLAYTILGCIYPCASRLPYAQMREAALRVGKAAFRKHVMGYLSVDMILFERAVAHTYAVPCSLVSEDDPLGGGRSSPGGNGSKDVDRMRVMHGDTYSSTTQDDAARSGINSDESTHDGENGCTADVGGGEAVGVQDEETGQDGSLQLWGVDVDLHLTNNAAAHRFAVTLTQARNEEVSSMYVIPRNRSVLRYVYSGIIYNPFIPFIRHGAFFSMGKIRAIAYQAEKREGVVYPFVDVLLRGCVAVLSIGTDMTMVMRRIGEFQRLLNLELPKQREHSSESNFVYFCATTRQLTRIWG